MLKNAKIFILKQHFFYSIKGGDNHPGLHEPLGQCLFKIFGSVLVFFREKKINFTKTTQNF